MQMMKVETDGDRMAIWRATGGFMGLTIERRVPAGDDGLLATRPTAALLPPYCGDDGLLQARPTFSPAAPFCGDDGLRAMGPTVGAPPHC